jgi:hypothetical protein
VEVLNLFLDVPSAGGTLPSQLEINPDAQKDDQSSADQPGHHRG